MVQAFFQHSSCLSIDNRYHVDPKTFFEIKKRLRNQSEATKAMFA
jgi:hypothetical protein